MWYRFCLNNITYTKADYLPYEAAKQWAQQSGITSERQWWRAKLPKNVPLVPDKWCQGKWEGWQNFLGDVEEFQGGNATYAPFDYAKQWARNNRIHTQQQWNTMPKPSNIPADPSKFYPQWKGWHDFFGVAKAPSTFVDFNTAREWARSHNLKSINDWTKLTLSPQFPPNIPKDPWNIYATSKWTGWNGMPDFLGYNHPSVLKHQRHKQTLQA